MPTVAPPPPAPCRTRYVEGPGGSVEGEVLGHGELSLPIEARPCPDGSPAALSDALEAAMAEPFDLGSPPLLRVLLLRHAAPGAPPSSSETCHTLCVTIHHAVSDAWSEGVVMSDLSAAYGAYLTGARDPLAAQPPLALQYADWAAAQREALAGPEAERQRAHWKQALAGCVPLLQVCVWGQAAPVGLMPDLLRAACVLAQLPDWQLSGC